MTNLNINYKVRKEPQQIVEGIDTILKDCYLALDKENELAVLSKAIVELPTLMNGLGYYLAEADANRDDAKDERDHYLDTEILKLMKDGHVVNKEHPEEKMPIQGLSKTQAESTVKVSSDYRMKQVKYLEAERIYKRLNQKYKAVDKSFEGMRSRLSIIKQEQERS